MANHFFLIVTLLSLFLLSGTLGVKDFKNAYIQNVKSEECITPGKDENDNPLFAEKCKCGPYQFWKLYQWEGEDYVFNEMTSYAYMYLTNAPSGSAVAIHGWTGSNWQRWKIHEEKDGSYTFVVKQTGMCLHQAGGGKIDQAECDDNDDSMKWKIVENPCGSLGKVPKGKFQLRNPATGYCAVVMDKSNSYWAKVVSEKCSCSNDYHYWTISEQLYGWELKSGGSSQCFANWATTNGNPGVTQCICENDAIHRWRFSPNEDGSFNIVTQIDGRCVYLDGDDEKTQLDYRRCNKNDPQQNWQFYDACEPEKYIIQPPKDVVPPQLNVYFQSGQMNWLTVTGYTLLVGGRWDSISSTWYTADGRQIQPGSELWSVYFGSATPSFLNILFQNDKTWNGVFGWMTPNFFQTWTPPPPPRPKDIIPDYMTPLFSSGQMNWLTPTRYALLSGGRWDTISSSWHTCDERQIQPGTDMWSVYFGTATPTFLSVLFQNDKTWNGAFGWMTPNFFRSAPVDYTTVVIPYHFEVTK